MYINLKFLNIV